MNIRYYPVFIIIFILYLISMAPTITATGDASEIIVASYVLGVAHPPGYPLITMLGKAFSYLPLSNIAVRINIMSAFFSVLSLLFFYLILVKLTKREAVSVLPVFFLAFIKLFWEYSIVAEVFSLNNFFIYVLIYVLMLWEEKRVKKLLYLFVFLFGLSLSHHHSILFLVPAFLFFFYKFRTGLKEIKHYAVFLILFFFAGLIPYIYPVIAAHFRPLLNWDDPVNLTNFIHLVKRADYAAPKVEMNHLFDTQNGQIWLYMRSLVSQFNVIGIIIGIIGMFFCFKDYKKYSWFLFWSYLMTSFVFVSLFGFTTDLVVINVVQRLYLMSFLIFAVYVGIGIASIFKYTFPLLIGLLLVFTAVNYKAVNKSDSYLLYDFCGNMIKSYPEKAILIVSGDTLSMGIDYLQMVEKVRNDIIILDQEKMTYSWYITQKKEQEKELNLPFDVYDGMANTIKDLFDANYGIHRIFVTGPKEKSHEQDYIMLGQGLLRGIYRKIDYIDIDKIKTENDEIWAKYRLRNTDINRYVPNSFESEIVTIYAKARFNQGWTYDLYKKPGYAVCEYPIAIQIDPGFAPSYKNLGIIYVNVYRRYKDAVKIWLKYLQLKNDDPEVKDLISEVRRLWQEQLRLYPNDKEAKIMAADLLKVVEDFYKTNPDDKDAKVIAADIEYLKNFIKGGTAPTYR